MKQQRVTKLERKPITFVRLQAELRGKEDTIARLQGEVKGKEDIITRLQGEARGKEDTIARLQGEAREKEDTIARLQGEVRGKEDIIARLEWEVRGREDTMAIARLEGEVRGKEDTITRLQEDVRGNEDTIARLEGEVRGKEDIIARLKWEVRGREDTITRLQEDVRGNEDTIARLHGEARGKEGIMARLKCEVSGREDTIARLQGDVRGNEDTIARLQEEARGREYTIARLQEEAREARGREDTMQAHHVTELRQVRLEVEQCQQQLREEQAQHRLLVRSHQRGEPVSPQALELWGLPREEVHISHTLLGTGGWGYVARGIFQGQTVAVKCLHRAILSPQNEGRLRREISIMSQVRHPNLLLLIGAVLTAEGEGPLIVTELLDRSLRSAYEERLLEERSKVPVLRDVACALTYLHSHRTPILHRDVSSANVLLEAIRHDRQWKAKLSDFGSANLSHLASTPAEGAAVYAAPEVSTEDRSRQTPKIDVYSFGVLVCEVCLCRFPPERDQFPSVLSEVHHTAPNLFLLSRDCTSHTHQDRPTMRVVLQRIDNDS